MPDTADLRNHIDCSQGKAFLDGEECMDAVSFSIVFSPVTSSTKTLGHTGEDTRWKGHTIKDVECCCRNRMRADGAY